MSLYKFIAGLKPVMSKEEVITSIQETTQIINKYTLPALKSAEQLWRGQSLKSAAAKRIESDMKREIKSKPMFEIMRSSMENALELLGYIDKYVERVFQENEANIGLSYAKATVLRLVQASELSSTYCRRLLNYVLWLECEQQKGTTQGPTQGEIRWLDDNYDAFALAMKALQKDKTALEHTLKNLPEATVTDTSEMSFISTLGIGNVDPFGMNNLSVRWNPFYLIGMLIADWQAQRYSNAQEEAKLLEYRRLQLERLREGKQDAKLDKEIEYLQDRLTGVYAKIDKMEKDYHV